MRHARFAWLAVALLAAAACAVGTTGTNGFEGDDGDGGDPWHARDGAASGGEGGVACTDTTDDPMNCGTCGHACDLADASALAAGDHNPDSGIPKADAGVAESWSSGEPACASSACGVTCPAAMTLCDDRICYDTSIFHEHCGDCATSCPATQHCSTGHCCDPGKAYCNTACIDVLSNNVNCGTCGNSCAVGKACVDGKCSACVTNEALVATASGSGGGTTTYGPDTAKDGVLEASACTSFAWITATNAPGTSWIQYSWPTAKTLTNMHMDTLPGAVADSCGVGRTLGAATVQWWNGTSWITDGTVTAKSDDWDYSFTAPITTTQVRLYAIYCTNTQGQNSNPVVFEWQVTGCN